MVEHYCLFETAIGACGVAWSDRGVTRLQLPEGSRSATECRLRGRGANASAGVPPAVVRAAIRLLERYFAGEQVDPVRRCSRLARREPVPSPNL